MNANRNCIAIGIVVFVAATVAAEEPVKESHKSEVVNSIEAATKIVTAVVGGLTFLFGLPVTLLLIKKTRAETRKLELEAAALQQKIGTGADIEKTADASAMHIRIHDSPNAFVQITADPRLLAPLLILLDFIIASVVIALARYVIGFVLSGPLATLLMIMLSALLYIPILRQALRIRQVLNPKVDGTDDGSTPNKAVNSSGGSGGS